MAEYLCDGSVVHNVARLQIDKLKVIEGSRSLEIWQQEIRFGCCSLPASFPFSRKRMNLPPIKLQTDLQTHMFEDLIKILPNF